MEDNRYRKSVGIILVNKDNKVFMGKRFDSSTEAWQLPQGGVEDGEPLQDAAWREMKEEIGTANAKLLHESDKWYHYDLPESIYQNLWNGRYIGQRQKWFVFQFLGDDSEINIATEVPEFKEWNWVDFSILPSLIVDFKQDLYKQLVQDLEPILKNIY